MYKLATLSLLAAAGLGAAQTLTGIPQCAQQCVISGLPSSCNLDPKCICESDSFIEAISCCVFKACDPQGQTDALNYARTICTPAGVTDLPVSAGCSAGASSTISESSSTSATSGASSTTDSAMSSATESASSSVSSAASSVSESAAAATTSAGNAAPGLAVQQGFGVVGAGLLGLAALL